MTAFAPPAPVVVGVDGSETALGAARWAADFAGKHALPLRLLHAIPKRDWHFLGAEAPGEPDRTAGGDGILAGVPAGFLAAAESAVRAAHSNLDITTAAVRGGVAAVLADASSSAQLVVVGAGSAEHRMLGGQALKVAHRTLCPVVVWRPTAAARTGTPLPVVVGIDESDDSTRTLAAAFDVARTLHAPLTVVHMWDIGAAVGMGDLGGQGNMDWPLLEVLQSRQRQRMEELIEPLRKHPSSHVTTVFQDVSPAKGLIEMSREARMVVVGSHGRGRLADSLLGSVSQTLIHHAECPVLIVR